MQRREEKLNCSNRRHVLECGGKRSATPLLAGAEFANNKAPGQFESGVTAAAVQDASRRPGRGGKLCASGPWRLGVEKSK
jgi:hypothetical protein